MIRVNRFLVCWLSVAALMLAPRPASAQYDCTWDYGQQRTICRPHPRASDSTPHAATPIPQESFGEGSESNYRVDLHPECNDSAWRGQRVWCESLPREERIKRLPGYIPEVKALIVGLRFFEAGFEGAPFNDRIYRRQFDSWTARFIYVELEVEGEASPGEAPLTCTYYDTQGNVLGRSPLLITVPPTPSGGDDWFFGVGWGARTPTWQHGAHRVECATWGLRTVAKGSFFIN